MKTGSAQASLVRFGPGNQLTGVLSGPAHADAPVLVLPNAGLVPKAGPFRLHVELADRLAARGVRTFRFDAPGVGEAPRVPGCNAQQATLAAMDRLSRDHGAERFVVGGICSAADLGWGSALADPRVVGMLMLDGISFTGFWFHFARILGVLQRGPAAWLGVASRLTARTASKVVEEARPTIAEYRDWPSAQQARSQFDALVARGVRSLWIYTGGFGDLFLHPRQFRANFGRSATAAETSMLHWPDCDHTFYARQHRDRLLDSIESWFDGWLDGSRRRPVAASPVT